MNGLVACIFAEFALLAMIVPGLSLLRRKVRGKLALALMPPALVTLPLLAMARLQLVSFYGSPTEAMTAVITAQALAIAFSLALCGTSALFSRRWPIGGPAFVALVAVIILASPVWGDVVLLLKSQTILRFTQTWLVAANPLFSISRAADFDWTHAAVLYNLSTRIGEDLVYEPASWRLQAIVYAAIGLLSAAVSVLVRQAGRPAEYLLSPGERL
ncbi:MAG: hypothetical protein JXL80_17290 [Planctomycetes bacterium]|nr:hypothetical protein [Planctomycetota bacterium]